MKIKIKIAFIGCGNMTKAILSSMLNPVTVAALKRNGKVLRIVVADRDEAALMPIKSVCDVTRDNAEAVEMSDYVVFAVKPQDFGACVRSLDLRGKTVISIMAGVSLDELARATGADRLVRAMPNINARVGEAFTTFCTRGIVEPDDKQTVLEILGAFGKTLEVRESEIGTATGIAGCGPAFVFKLLDAFTQEAVSRGFSSDVAREMAIQTVIGSAITAEASECGFGELVSSVCSRGGATAEGVAYLDGHGFSQALRGAIGAAIDKASALGDVGDE